MFALKQSLETLHCLSLVALASLMVISLRAGSGLWFQLEAHLNADFVETRLHYFDQDLVHFFKVWPETHYSLGYLQLAFLLAQRVRNCTTYSRHENKFCNVERLHRSLQSVEAAPSDGLCLIGETLNEHL